MRQKGLIMETLLNVNTSPTAAEFPRGVALLRDPLLNKGTAFSEKERDALMHCTIAMRRCSSASFATISMKFNH